MRRLFLALLVAGCSHGAKQATPCAPGLTAQLEVRDASGQVELALKNNVTQDGELDLCDAQAKRVGRFVRAGDAVQVLDADGQLVAKIHHDGPNDLSGEGPKGPLFRVHWDEHETRVLKPDGVPFGSVAARAGGATLLSPGSAPIGSVAPRDKDQVIAGPDGATRMYVVAPKPVESSVNAGLLALEGLPLPVRLAVYRFVSIKGG
jgi:hypothetical protein